MQNVFCFTLCVCCELGCAGFGVEAAACCLSSPLRPERLQEAFTGADLMYLTGLFFVTQSSSSHSYNPEKVGPLALLSPVSYPSLGHNVCLDSALCETNEACSATLLFWWNYLEQSVACLCCLSSRSPLPHTLVFWIEKNDWMLVSRLKIVHWKNAVY